MSYQAEQQQDRYRRSHVHGALTALAEQVWPGAVVRYRREFPRPRAGKSREYWLERPLWTPSPYVELGASREEAEARLRELTDAADLDAIAETVASMIRDMQPGESYERPTRRCTKSGRPQMAIRGRKLRERVLAVLGDGWSYTKHGAWWDRPETA